MRRATAIILALCICLVPMLLTACNEQPEETKKPTESASPTGGNNEQTQSGEHTHSWMDFSFNDDEHWRYCSEDECEEIADLGEHVWDDGEITVQPSNKGDGVRTFKCVDCGHTRTESVQYVVVPTVTAEEWTAAFDEFDNCGITVYQDVYKMRFDGVWSVSEKDVLAEKLRVAENGYSLSNGEAETVYIKDGDITQYKRVSGAEQWTESKADKLPSVKDSTYISVLLAMKDKGASFTYSDSDKQYMASEITYTDIASGGTKELRSISIGFENGKIYSVTYVSVVSEGNGESTSKYKYEVRITFEDYGTTVVSTPVSE